MTAANLWREAVHRIYVSILSPCIHTQADIALYVVNISIVEVFSLVFCY